MVEIPSGILRFFEHVGIAQESLTRMGNTNSSYDREVVRMSDEELINYICAAFERTSGPWPVPLTSYPSVLAMIHRAAVERQLPKPKMLQGSDWPWSEVYATTHQSACNAYPEFREKEERDFETSDNFYAQMNRKSREQNKNLDSQGMEDQNMNAETPNSDPIRRSFPQVWLETAKSDLELGKNAAIYSGTKSMLKDMIYPVVSDYEGLLPEWAFSPKLHAVLFYFAGSAIFARLETLDLGDGMFANMGRSLSRAVAQGAAAELGGLTGEQIYGLLRLGIAQINKYLRPKGFGFDDKGNIVPAAMLPQDNTEEIELLTQQHADLLKMNQAQSEQIERLVQAVERQASQAPRQLVDNSNEIPDQMEMMTQMMGQMMPQMMSQMMTMMASQGGAVPTEVKPDGEPS